MSHETFEKALASDARTPIGLDLGGETAGDIALSIVSEVIAGTHGKSGSPLSVSVSVSPFAPQGGEKVARSAG